MPLPIETKQDHPIAIAYRDQYGSVYFISADEFNAIVEQIDKNEESIGNVTTNFVPKWNGSKFVNSLITHIGDLVKVDGNFQANKLITSQQASNAIPNTFWVDNSGNPMFTNGAGVSKPINSGSNVFVYTPTGNFTISAIKTAMESAGLIFNDSHIIINLGANNYTCSIDLEASNYIFTIGRRGTGSISFSSTRTLNSGTDAITILNGNESSMALIDCGTTTDFLKIRNF